MIKCALDSETKQFQTVKFDASKALKSVESPLLRERNFQLWKQIYCCARKRPMLQLTVFVKGLDHINRIRNSGQDGDGPVKR